MLKRLFAILLCLTMLMSYVVPAAYAAENDTVSTDDIFLGNGATINNFKTEGEKEESSLSPTVDNTSAEDTVPECSCGVESVIADHEANCVLKCWYRALVVKPTAELYALWEELPEDAQGYILQCLTEEKPQKQAELQSMLNTDLSARIPLRWMVLSSTSAASLPAAL